MKKLTLSNLLKNKTLTLVFSLFIALVFWFIVAYTISTNTVVSIRNVPVQYLNSESYKSKGIDIIDKTVHTVTVQVEGERNIVGSLDKNDIIVTPDFTSVTEAGVYDLRLIATRADTTINYIIESVEEPIITLRFDKSESVNKKVETAIEGIEVAEGYTIGTITATPAEVVISGSNELISAVDSVVAVGEVTEVLGESIVVKSDIKLLDVHGNEVSKEGLLLDFSQVDVSIPVLKSAVLPLEIGFLNIPEGFDLTTLEYTLTPNELEVAAVESIIDTLTPRTVGYIDLAAFNIGDDYEFEIQLPTGYVNLNSVASATVTFARDTLASQQIRVEDIRLDNVPSNYDVELKTNEIRNVTLIGEADVVENLLSGSIVAVADLAQYTIKTGEFSIPVRFEIPSSDSVFVAGSYSVLVTAQPN